MSFFDDVVHGVEKVAETVVHDFKEVSDDLGSAGLSVINDMRGAASVLPLGFPAAAAILNFDEILPVASVAESSFSKFLAHSLPDGRDGDMAIQDYLGQMNKAEQMKGHVGKMSDWAFLNPQPLPPGPDDLRRVDHVALNPQPLPPGPDDLRRVDRVALNPQPLPPGPDDLRRVDRVALNPQPLPPGPDDLRRIDRVALNPQPLPPGPDDLRQADRVALNPQPLPPGPDDRMPVWSAKLKMAKGLRR